MPLSRYQIRNEYSLADPELYRAADKDDPEELLEGVAMAGLVGVLRQLGDLAEFAAEIFHDLHEEVMMTAARGHSLMFRIQQLEAEFPTIEKEFLSQTNHSSFFYNPGIDWHPNMHMDQNLITRGDLPRFIMDSYEECRGPPRLFLLDKFDVAGAGACLKRYTDPSFFKVETASFRIMGSDVRREKKVRKAKKKGSRWRNGETPEALPTSHAKLHQLFLEEYIENGISDPARRVKLKRRLNGFPFQSKCGKSYMEKFLRSPSPDHTEVHEVPVDSSPLPLPSNSDYEYGFGMVEISTVSPEKKSKHRSISQSSSPTKEGTNLELFIDELNEIHMGTEISEVLETDPGFGAYNFSDPGLEAYDIPSTLHMADSEKDVAVDRQSKTDGSVDDYQSDDIASERDNYMDALTTMESEMVTDSELKTKNDLRYLNSGREAIKIYANAEQPQAHSSDSQSTGNSTLSDDRNSSSKKDMSSFSYSDTHSTSADNAPSDGEVFSNVFPSAEIHEHEIIDTSLAQQSTGKDDPLSQFPERVVSDDATVEAAKTPEQSTELGDPTCSSSPQGSVPAYRSAETLVDESTLMHTESDQLLTNLSLNIPCISSLSDASQPKEENSPARLSGEKQHLDEKFEVEDNDRSETLPGSSYLYVPSHTKADSPLKVLAENQLVDELNDEGLNVDDNEASTPYLLTDSPLTNAENPPMLFPEDQPPDGLHGEDPNLNENTSLASSLSDVSFLHRDGFSHAVSAENLPGNELGGRDPNSVLDASVSVSNMMEATAEKKSNNKYFDSAHEIGNMEEHCVQNSDDNQIVHQNPVMLLTQEQPVDATHYLGIQPGDTVSGIDDVNPTAGEIALNVNPKEDTSSESVESFVCEIFFDVPPIRSSKEGISYVRENHFDDCSDTGDGAVMGKASSNVDLLQRDCAGESSFVAGNNVPLDGIDTEPVNGAADFAGPANKAIEGSDGSSADPETLQGGSLTSFEGEDSAFRTTEACFSNRHSESGITEDADQQDLTVLNNDHPESQILGDVSDTYLVSEAKNTLNLDNSSTVQSSLEENEMEPSLPEEKVELLHAERFPNACEAKSELTQLQQTQHADHTDHIGFVASSESLSASLPSQPSLSLSPQIGDKTDISEEPIYPLSSISSRVSLLPDASQIYVEEMPPMPPLPPVQWRMGRLQLASPAQEGVFVQHDAGPFAPILPLKADQDAELLNPLLLQSALGEKSPLASERQMGKAVHFSPFSSLVPSVVHLREMNDDMLAPKGTQIRDTSLKMSSSDGEMQQNCFQAEEREKVESRLISHISDEDGPAYSLGSSHEEFIKPLKQGIAETGLREELVQSPALLEENVATYDTTAQPSKVENEQPQQPIPDSAYSSGLSPEKLTRPLNQAAPETSMMGILGQISGYSEENLVTSNITPLPSKTENEQNEQPQQAIPNSTYSSGLSPEKLMRPLNQAAPETSMMDRELGQTSGYSEENLFRTNITPLPSKAENEQPRDRTTLDETPAWPGTEDDKPNGHRLVKVPRPRNPIIDAVAAHDKSKLRKVTEQVRPQIQEEERDSLLAQIRTKSFNLKPAVVSRPSIQGPNTNLKVAAILEKAKTIRQAFAGSDEDDDDSWSDS